MDITSLERRIKGLEGDIKRIKQQMQYNTDKIDDSNQF